MIETITPETIVPPDVLAQGQRSKSSTKRLMTGILEEALHCFQSHIDSPYAREHALYLDAEDWFASRDPGPLFSFEHICRVLDLDANAIRHDLRNWRDAAHADAEPTSRGPGGRVAHDRAA